MKILEIEKEYTDLQSFLSEASSRRTKLIRISEFFDLVLSTSNLNLIEAYISDFLPRYFTLIKLVKIRGLNPDVLVKIIDQLAQLNKFDFVQKYSLDIEDSLTILKNKHELLSSWMTGHLTKPDNNLIYFPVIEKSKSSKVPGFLEIIKVGISAGESKFVIEPAESEEDAQLEKQLYLCWQVAVDYCKKYIKKIKPNHTVELKFENKLGIYIGSSFGIALTLTFIEAILKHYNSKMIVSINGCIAVTGGIDKNSNILSTSKLIIETKVETVFYSDAHIFCIPKTDEIWAEEKLKELKLLFPKRDLTIIGLTGLNDLLDRRQIVDIKKQKLVIRSGKFVKKNWISAVATVLLAIFFAYLFVMDFDDNPASLTTDGNLLFVRNKSSRILWTKRIGLSKDAINDPKLLGLFCKVYDIDSDGDNEVLISNELLTKENSNISRGKLLCYDKENTILWSYSFTDSVKSEREILKPLYSILLIDTLTIQNKKSLFLISTNSPSFSSAIYRIDLRTGERFPGTMWCSGHTVEALIKDVNNDNKKEILAVGLDNGFEEQVVFAYTIDTLTKVRPSIKDYTIKNYPLGDFISYIRIPKTDFTKYIKLRIPGFDSGSLVDETVEKAYRFIIAVNYLPEGGHIWLKLDYNLKDFDIVIGNQFRILRDSLVAQGKLNLPFTDTEEYKNIIKSNMLYWKDGNWVTRDAIQK